jgi:phage-related protein
MVPTANMQLFVSISDFNETVNITEAAFDYFSITNSNVLSIDEKKNGMELEFAVYPNPFTNEFTIGGDIEQISSIRLLDVSGVELIYQSNPLIDTSKLAKGVYFLQITTLDNQLVTKTVVKN